MLKGCLVTLAIVILVVLGLRLIFGTLVFIGAAVTALVAVVPAWAWAIGAVAVLIWAVRTRGQENIQ